MARKEIQHSIQGRNLGLSNEGWIVANLQDKTQIVVSPTGVLLTDANNNTTTISGTGTGVARSIPYSTVIDLSTTGSGSAMTETSLAASSTFTYSGQVEGGNCTFILVGDGTHTPVLTNFVSGNGYVYSNALGARNLYVAVYEYGSPILYGSLLNDIGAGTPVSYSTTIPLDKPEAGKYMPQTVLFASSVFTYSGQVEKGNCNFSLVGDGAHSPDFSAFTLANGYVYSPTVGANNIYSAVYAYGSALLYGTLGAPTFISFPTLTSAIVSDTDATRIDLVWSRAVNSTVSAAAAFAVSAGHSLTSHTYDTATTSHLVTSTPFVQGETKTLAYTQPVSNKMQDLSGNLVASFTGTAIADNVTTPVLVSAIVANATPSKIDLTWSKSIPNTTLSATANFAVSSGHTLTGTHTWIDATHSQLTTSSNFVNGETKTLAYAPSGTADMHDTNNNLVAAFSGFAITDNVGASGVFVRLDVNVGGGVTETGSSGAGYNYIGQFGTNAYTSGLAAVSTKTLAVSTDGYIRCTLNLVSNAGDNELILGLYATQSTSFPAGYAIGVGDSRAYMVMGQFGSATPNGVTGRTPVTGDLIRVRRSGTSIIGEVSSDTGASWVTIHTFSGASTAALYAQAYVTAAAGANVIFSDVMA